MELARPRAEGTTEAPTNLRDSIVREPVTDFHQAEEFVTQDLVEDWGNRLGHYVRSAPTPRRSAQQLLGGLSLRGLPYVFLCNLSYVS